jgi:phage-related protein
MSIPKTLDNFKIQLQNGLIYDMADTFSVLVRSFRISSPSPSRQTEQIDGRDGQLRLGKDFGPREITAVCSFFAVDYADSLLLRDDIISVLYGRDPFYIIPDATPGKRWLVEASDSMTPELIGMYGEFTLSFISDSTYAESIGTTLDPLTFDAELWQVGQGLTVDATDYTQTAATFSIYNAGDITVDPREFPLVITFKGASTNLAIVNSTTVTEWDYTGTTTASDTVMLDGVRMLKNGVSVFGSTNRKLVTLAPGWNDIQVFGATGAFTISFDFRFRYI